MSLPTPRVLVVEDDPVVSSLLVHILATDGYVADVVGDGRAALDALDTREPPELVLLDLMLPYADGRIVLRKLRANPRWAQVPVLILTASTLQVVGALDDGADDYVAKPFSPDELLARLRRLRRRATLPAVAS